MKVYDFIAAEPPDKARATQNTDKKEWEKYEKKIPEFNCSTYDARFRHLLRI